MALITIPLEALRQAGLEANTLAWCRQLEAGDILYFPQTPISLKPGDLSFLLGQQQTGSTLHKNIAYKPNLDSVSGLDAGSAGSAEVKQLQSIMRQYSQDVTRFLTGFLLPYHGRWQLDYASFRPQEEEGRDLPLRRRNDLLHTDAFPTRPTRGARILRFFNNIHPTRTRDWVSHRSIPSAGAEVCSAANCTAGNWQPGYPGSALPGEFCRARARHTQPEAVALRRLHDALPQFS